MPRYVYRCILKIYTNATCKLNTREWALTDCGDGSDDLSKLELVEDGGLTSRIETHHEDPHLLLGEEAAEELREGEPHVAPTAPMIISMRQEE
jgi:hypothetical protein